VAAEPIIPFIIPSAMARCSFGIFSICFCISPIMPLGSPAAALALVMSKKLLSSSLMMCSTAALASKIMRIARDPFITMSARPFWMVNSVVAVTSLSP